MPPERGDSPDGAHVCGEVPLPFQLLINALDGMVDAGALQDQNPEILAALGERVVDTNIAGVRSCSDTA